MSGLGNPVALQANFTVDHLRTVKLMTGCREEIKGGTEKKRKTSYIFLSKHQLDHESKCDVLHQGNNSLTYL